MPPRKKNDALVAELARTTMQVVHLEERLHELVGKVRELEGTREEGARYYEVSPREFAELVECCAEAERLLEEIHGEQDD